jgi:hypothetical protein
VEAGSLAERCSHSGVQPFLQIIPGDHLGPLGSLQSDCSLLLPDPATVQVFEQLATVHSGLINPPCSSAPKPIVDSDWLFWP